MLPTAVVRYQVPGVPFVVFDNYSPVGMIRYVCIAYFRFKVCVCSCFFRLCVCVPGIIRYYIPDPVANAARLAGEAPAPPVKHHLVAQRHRLAERHSLLHDSSGIAFSVVDSLLALLRHHPSESEPLSSRIIGAVRRSSAYPSSTAHDRDGGGFVALRIHQRLLVVERSKMAPVRPAQSAQRKGVFGDGKATTLGRWNEVRMSDLTIRVWSIDRSKIHKKRLFGWPNTNSLIPSDFHWLKDQNR